MTNEEFEGMPPKAPTAKLSFLGATSEAERQFDPKESVRFEVHGYVYEKGTRFLEDADNPIQEFVKIQVTSIKEI